MICSISLKKRKEENIKRNEEENLLPEINLLHDAERK